MAKNSPENDVIDLNLTETELTLGLPGRNRSQKSGTKRGFSETVDLNLGRSSVVESGDANLENHQSENEISEAPKSSTSK